MISQVDSNHKGAVYIGDALVGAVLYDVATKFTLFEYDAQWLKVGFSISPKHLPLQAGVFEVPLLSFETYKGLPAALADTLPDDFGNAVINAWLARNGRTPESFSPVERLLYSGKRGMGALEYRPAIRKQGNKAIEIHMASLVEMAQTILDQRSNLLADTSETGLSEILQVGTSAGGARPKAVIGINADRSKILSGQVKLPKGFEYYLLKFDGVSEHSKASEVFGDPKGYGRMEYAYYLMAKDAGINMMPCELLLDGPRAHFMTQRFDRVDGEKIHYQSLCAMDHADYKKPGHYSYEELFLLMRFLKLGRDDAEQMVRRMIFNVVARNHDDHTKNAGFIFVSGKWKLAPAFDVAYSYRPGSPWVNSHQMTINGKRTDFIVNDFIAALQSSPVFQKMIPTILKEIIEVVSQWKVYAAKTEVPAWLSEEVEGNLRLNWEL
jgi:serine/threonine-protein kinase HipA